MNIVQITAETLPRYRQALAALMIDAEKNNMTSAFQHSQKVKQYQDAERYFHSLHNQMARHELLLWIAIIATRLWWEAYSSAFVSAQMDKIARRFYSCSCIPALNEKGSVADYYRRLSTRQKAINVVCFIWMSLRGLWQKIFTVRTATTI